MKDERARPAMMKRAMIAFVGNDSETFNRIYGQLDAKGQKEVTRRLKLRRQAQSLVK